jgi:hypothetical protein
MKTYFLLIVERYDYGALKSHIFERKRESLPKDMHHRRPGMECSHFWFETLEAAQHASLSLELQFSFSKGGR